ncbi:MAG: hypothetical protein IKP77_05225 [Acholeplasmatales bacterium]|nr:hypothetical protein [Acholeplasmatales bacterium]
MEELINRTKIKLIVMSSSLILPIAILFIMSFDSFDWVEKDNSIFVNAPYVPYIASAILFGWIGWKLVKYIRILKSEDFANKVLIGKTDERIKYLKMRANALTYKIFLYVMGVAVIFCAFINWGYFFFSIGVLIVFLVIHGIVYFVFLKKF